MKIVREEGNNFCKIYNFVEQIDKLANFLKGNKGTRRKTNGEQGNFDVSREGPF